MTGRPDWKLAAGSLEAVETGLQDLTLSLSRLRYRIGSQPVVRTSPPPNNVVAVLEDVLGVLAEVRTAAALAPARGQDVDAALDAGLAARELEETVRAALTELRAVKGDP